MPALVSRHPFFIGLLAITTVAFIWLLSGFWQPVFWAAVIGILFRPVQVQLEKRLGGRGSLSAVLTVILIVVTVLVPAMLVASAVAGEAAGLYARIQSGEVDIAAPLRWLQGLMPQMNEWAARVNVDLNDVTEKLSTAAVRGSQFMASLALSTGQNVARFVVMFFVMLYLLFFVVRDGDLMLEALHRAMPLPYEQERRLFRKFAEVSRATIKGTLIIGVIQGTLGGLIFAALGIQGAVFWGVVMVLLSVLPAVGAGIVWLPAAVILLLNGDYGKAIILVVFGVTVIGLVDNLLRPMLVGRDTKMPDYLMLLSTLGGLATVGITGFVAGPVVAALCLACWQIFAEEGEQAEESLAAAADPSPAETGDASPG